MFKYIQVIKKNFLQLQPPGIMEIVAKNNMYAKNG